MTTYIPQTKFTFSGDRWEFSNQVRYATREEAEASMDHIRAGRPDLVATRVVESPHKATRIWTRGMSIDRAVPRPAARGKRRKPY